MNIHSIDLHRDEETVNEFYAVSPIDVEEEVMLSIEFEEVTSVLEEKKSQLYCTLVRVYHRRNCYQIRDEKSTVHTRKTRAFLKMNPDYKPLKQKSFS